MCLERNPRLVFARMTGWGQDGPWSQAAGHDMNYIAITGALHGLGQDPGRPHFPSNLLGDFGGGSTYLVIGILAALLEARASGQGQVVDAAIVDGTAHLNAMRVDLRGRSGSTPGAARSGMLDGGTPWYDLYETADGEHVSVGALEPQFWTALVERIGVDLPDRDDPANHAAIRDALTARFKERTQAEWAEVFDGTDACVAPVVPLSEAPRAPAPRRARHLRRARRRHPAGAGAALLAHRRHDQRSRPRCPASTPARRWPPGASPTSTRSSPAAPRPRPVTMLPFLFLGTRAEDDVAQQEYDAVLAGCGLRPDELVRVRLEQGPLGEVDLADWSGIILGGGPFNVSDPEDTKSAAQLQRRGRPPRPRRPGGRRGLPVPRRLLRHRRPRRPAAAASSTGPTASRSARCRCG